MFNKKGFIGGLQTFLVIILVVFMVGITAVLSSNIFGEFNDEVQSSNDFSEVSKNSTSSLNTSLPTTMDWVVIIVYSSAFIFFLITAYLSTTNPWALGVAILLLVLFAIFPMIISNVWDEFSSDADLQSEITKYPNTNFLLDNYGVAFIIIFSVGIIVGALGNARGVRL
jgi:small-conductance mechanosensitive channel